MKKVQKNWLEWTVFAVSLALLLATVGLLAWDAATTDDSPPLLALDPISVVREGDALRVSVTVRNEGGQAAQQVEVEVEIAGGGEGQRGSFQLDLLPGGSQATGELFFFGAPAGDVRAQGRVAGYSLP